jgi:hypothetical protein
VADMKKTRTITTEVRTELRFTRADILAYARSRLPSGVPDEANIYATPTGYGEHVDFYDEAGEIIISWTEKTTAVEGA